MLNYILLIHGPPSKHSDLSISFHSAKSESLGCGFCGRSQRVSVCVCVCVSSYSRSDSRAGAEPMDGLLEVRRSLCSSWHTAEGVPDQFLSVRASGAPVMMKMMEVMETHDWGI